MAINRAQTEADMQGKQPMRSHKGYEMPQYGGRKSRPTRNHPQFTGTGIRVDRDFPVLSGEANYVGPAEYASDLSGRVSR